MTRKHQGKEGILLNRANRILAEGRPRGSNIKEMEEDAGPDETGCQRVKMGKSSQTDLV